MDPSNNPGRAPQKPFFKRLFDKVSRRTPITPVRRVLPTPTTTTTLAQRDLPPPSTAIHRKPVPVASSPQPSATTAAHKRPSNYTTQSTQTPPGSGILHDKPVDIARPKWNHRPSKVTVKLIGTGASQSNQFEITNKAYLDEAAETLQNPGRLILQVDHNVKKPEASKTGEQRPDFAHDKRNIRLNATALISVTDSTDSKKPTTTILIDLGYTYLQALNRPPDAHSISSVKHVLFTHLHGDATGGVDSHHKNYIKHKELPHYYMDEATHAELKKQFSFIFKETGGPGYTIIKHGETFDVGGVKVTCFRVKHDRIYAMGFIIEDVLYCSDLCEIPEESYAIIRQHRISLAVLGLLRLQNHPAHNGIGPFVEQARRIGAQCTTHTQTATGGMTYAAWAKVWDHFRRREGGDQIGSGLPHSEPGTHWPYHVNANSTIQKGDPQGHTVAWNQAHVLHQIEDNQLEKIADLAMNLIDGHDHFHGQPAKHATAQKGFNILPSYDEMVFKIDNSA